MGMSVSLGASNGTGTLRAALNQRMESEKTLPATLRFTVYDTGSQITTADFADTPPTIKADHTAPADAIQYCIANLTSGRTAYESIHVVVPDASLDAKLTITDDWTEIDFCGELMSAPSGLNTYFVYAEGVDHIRIKGANFDHAYNLVTAKSGGGGIQFERCNHIYVGDCYVDNAFQESFEVKTCSNVYFENCTGDDFGDDAFSILDSNHVLTKNCTASNARGQSPFGSGCFEWEDGSHHCVSEDCTSDTSADEGIHVIVDGNKSEVIISGITEPDPSGSPGVYRAATSGVASYSIGKDIQIYSTTSGEQDGVWEITNVDFSGGTWVDFDMGAANTGLVGTDSNFLNFTHGAPHDIYIYNHTLRAITGAAVSLTSLGTVYNLVDATEAGLKAPVYNVFIDGLNIRSCTAEALVISYGEDIVIRNMDAVGLPATQEHGVNASSSNNIKFYDSNIRHYGNYGIRCYQVTNAEFYRTQTNDNAEHASTTSGYGFYLDADLWDYTLQTRTNSSTQDAGFVLTDCEGYKTTNWAGNGDYKSGIRIQDAASSVVTNCTITEFSGSEVIDYAGGTTAGNTTLTNVVSFTNA